MKLPVKRQQLCTRPTDEFINKKGLDIKIKREACQPFLYKSPEMK